MPVLFNKALFEQFKSQLDWEQTSNWVHGQGRIFKLEWAAFRKGAAHRIPMFFVHVDVDVIRPDCL